LNVNYGTGKTIFIEHMNDLFADEVPGNLIEDILDHCYRFPGNNYVFQTKNPGRALSYEGQFPVNHIIGTTIETNRDIPGSGAPPPADRYYGIKDLMLSGCKTFITIEPIMDFDVEILTDWIITAQPDFINIGADSKNTGLPEPSAEKISALIKNIQVAGVPIRKKMNLQRLIDSKAGR
jgi:DNA repair photolyase